MCRLLQVFVLLCLFALTSQAQNRVELLSAQNALNLYLGVPVRVVHNGRVLHKNEYQAEITEGSGTCVKTDDALIINAGSVGRTEILIKDSKGRELGRENFLVHVPYIAMTINGCWRGHGWIQKNTFPFLKGIVPICENFPYSFRAYVDSFWVTLYIGRDIRRVRCTGPLLSQELRDLIDSTTGGDKIIFNNFSFHNKAGQIRNTERIAYDIAYDDPAYAYRWIVSGLSSLNDPDINYDSIDRVNGVPDVSMPAELQEVRMTNCKINTDTCTTTIAYIINDAISLSKRYSYIKSEIAGSRWYYRDTLLAALNYSDTGLSYDLYYRNGKKRQEGYYLIQCEEESSMGTNPLTLEFEITTRDVSRGGRMKDGLWRYYNEQGDLVKTVRFDRDQEIK